MGSFSDFVVLAVFFCILNCSSVRVSGLVYGTENDACSVSVAKKSIPFCYAALYDVNMRAKETSQSARRTFCCCLHGVERCLRSTFSYFGCTSEKLIEEEFVNLVTESLKNGDMVLDGPCEDYEDDDACRAEVSAFDNAVVAFTKVVPVRPDVRSGTTRSTNRQPRVETLNSSSSDILEESTQNGTSNGTQAEGNFTHNCTSSSNTSHGGCSKSRSDSERTQRAFLEWESSKQLVVIVTDENGERLVLTINKRGSGVLVNTVRTDPEPANDLLEWSQVTKVLGVIPTEENSSAVLVTNTKEDGTLYYDGKFRNQNEVVPHEVFSIMKNIMNSTKNNSAFSFYEEDENSPDDYFHEQFGPAVNRTPRFFFNLPKSETELRYNLSEFMKSVNESWYKLVNSFSVLENQTRNQKSASEYSLYKVYNHSEQSVANKSEVQPHYSNISSSLDDNDTSIAERNEHSRGLFNKATLPPFPEEPSMSNITEHPDFQVLFFGLWPAVSSTSSSSSFPTIKQENASDSIAPNNTSAKLPRGARQSNEKPQDSSPCIVGNFSENATASRESYLNCSKEKYNAQNPKSSRPSTLNSSEANQIGSSASLNYSSANNEERQSRYGLFDGRNILYNPQNKSDTDNFEIKLSSLINQALANSETAFDVVNVSKGNHKWLFLEELIPGLSSDTSMPSQSETLYSTTTTQNSNITSRQENEPDQYNHNVNDCDRKARSEANLTSLDQAMAFNKSDQSSYTTISGNGSENLNFTNKRETRFELSNSTAEQLYPKNVDDLSYNIHSKNESYEKSTVDHNSPITDRDERSANLVSGNSNETELFINASTSHQEASNRTSTGFPQKKASSNVFENEPNATMISNQTHNTTINGTSNSIEQSKVNNTDVSTSHENASDSNLVHHVARRETAWSRASRVASSWFTLGEMDINLS